MPYPTISPADASTGEFSLSSKSNNIAVVPVHLVILSVAKYLYSACGIANQIIFGQTSTIIT